MLANKSLVSCTPMWDILVLLSWRICVAICIEDKDEMILSMEIIRYLCKLTYDSYIPCLIIYCYDLGWYLVFELVLSLVMVMEALVGYIIG